MEIKAIFDNLCPNCEKSISDLRLRSHSVCSKCLPKDIQKPFEEKVFSVYKQLLEFGKLRNYSRIYSLLSQAKEAEEIFSKATNGFRLWGAQRAWLKRLLKGKSFSIIASTGIGKTTFGMFMAVYFGMKNKKSYLILPTTTLVKQAVERIKKFEENLGIDVGLAYYYSKLKEKEGMKERIAEGDFKILVTSSQFLATNFELLQGKKFDFIFVDDVDAFLKASKNIEKVLLLLGFSQEIIKAGYKLLNLKLAPERNEKAIKKLEDLIQEFKQKNRIGCLIVSSATGRAKGRKVKIYRELLDFDIGHTKEIIRNIEDCYAEEFGEDKLIHLLKKFGKGGLVFVPVDMGIEYAKTLSEKLREKGIKAGVVYAGNKKDLESFEKEELDVLVGVATYYGSLVRGLDLPHLIRYAIFYGVPKFRFSLSLEKSGIFDALSLMNILSDVLEGEDKQRLDSIYFRLRKIVRSLDAGSLKLLESSLQNGEELKSQTLIKAKELLVQAKELLGELLENEAVLERLKKYEFASLKKEGNELKISIPDVRTYIQASGRTSRLFAGGVTKGLSVVLIDDPKVFHGLVRSMRWVYPDSEFKRLDEMDLYEVFKQIDEDRERVRAVIAGKAKAVTKDLVKSGLMIVESPNKARTIANFFGKPSRRRIGKMVCYEVNTGDYILTIVATAGHVMDLVSDKGYDGVLLLNDRFVPVYGSIKRCPKCGTQFVDSHACPKCGNEEIIDKLETLKVLSELAEEVDEVFIATDADAEGEKIAWDIYLALKPYSPKLKRTEFHEVTRRAIQEAIINRRDVDEKLVEAQIVRRVEDRWIGFGLSELLWKKFKNTKLSAGRVQTPVLGWIIQREKEFKESFTT
ncbi:MAG: reverse gyrase, partial [Candidatus Aenigmarchaeota archaeon]|nr:reverse gyrase [Candidatus Aenigmarchaeota archaeon]